MQIYSISSHVSESLRTLHAIGVPVKNAVSTSYQQRTRKSLSAAKKSRNAKKHLNRMRLCKNMVVFLHV